MIRAERGGLVYSLTQCRRQRRLVPNRVRAAHALAGDILEGHELAVQNYLSLLKAGRSMYGMDLFRLAGIDMSTREPVEKTFGVLAGIVDRQTAAKPKTKKKAKRKTKKK